MQNKKELEKSFNRKRGDLREKSPFSPLSIQLF